MSDMRFWYPASITQITSINDSFDSCMLSVCYAGRNRNQSNISKEAIEKAIPTMAYCPLVANYSVESDEIGGHDVDFVETDAGIKMVNLTDAIGVIPENPQWCWVTKTDKDGVDRDYLCTPAIIWKRTPVYEKLKREGVTGQSMEISVKDGRIVDGLYDIYDFEFTAFCLLGDNVEPCFEGAQVEMFSMSNLSERLKEMMDDFKLNYSKVIAASADDDKTPSGEESNMKGGESSLNYVEELLQKYGLNADDINFEIGDMSREELDGKFAELHEVKFCDDGENTGDNSSEDQTDTQSGDGQDDAGQQDVDQGEGGQEGGGQDDDDTEEEDAQEDDSDDAPAGQRKQYQLTGGQLLSGIIDALHEVMFTDEWGEWARYCYADYDPAINEVYAYDNEDWNLYGFKYSMNGDNVVIDFDSKTRKRIAFVDFDNGTAQFSYKHLLDSANAKFDALANEVAGLREFKRKTESAARNAKIEEVFSKFVDLCEDQRFIDLKNNCDDMSVEDIEDKCFAIRGRNAQVKFSQNTPAIRLPVEGRKPDTADTNEPYNGVFVEFGFDKK